MIGCGTFFQPQGGGGGGLGKNTFTIANNQAVAQNITGFLLDEAVYEAVVARYTIVREDDTPTDRREIGLLTLEYNRGTGNWTSYRQTLNNTDALNAGVDSLEITTAGQMQYKSDNMSGANYGGAITWEIVWAVNTESI